MKTMTHKISTILMTLAMIQVALLAQGQTTYKQSGDSYIMIAGTSTLHNWTMTSKEMSFQATIENGADGNISQVTALNLTLTPKSLKSPHTAMDNNAYSALKADKYKAISYAMTTAKVVKNVVQCSGNLAISGVTKPVTVEASCKTKPDGSMLCTGSKAIKMSDFQVEPPTFMFGTVKTGDEITISFNLQLSPVKN